MSDNYLNKEGLRHFIEKITDRIDETQHMYIVDESICTLTTDDTKGVAPYSTSYGYTNIEIAKDSGIEWVEGAIYTFLINTKLIVVSNNRNVRVRIGGNSDGDVWHPLMGYSTTILGGNTYFVKNMTCVFQYKETIRTEGGLHLLYDANSTYAYLVNTVAGDATDSAITIDSNGYGARYSLIFPTTPLSNENGIVTNETWSSLVKSSSTGTTKTIPTGLKFYIDRQPLYIYSANVAASAKPVNAVYQDYTGFDIRYTVNTNSTYLTRNRKAFLFLKNFNPTDMSFEADATIGNVMTIDKISTRFPTSVSGDVYLYFLGYTGANYYSITPAFTQANKLYKYTPSTKEFTNVKASADSTEDKIKITTISFTTNGQGNASLNLDDNVVVLSIKVPSYIAVPYWSASTQSWMAHVSDITNASAANTACNNSKITYYKKS